MRKIIVFSILILLLAAVGYVITTKRSVPTDTLILSELGVTLRVSKDISNLTYATATATPYGTILLMRSPTLVINNKPCELGALYLLAKKDVGTSTIWTAENIEAAVEEQQDTPPRAKDLGSEYLIFQPSQSPCTTNDDQNTLKSEGFMRMSLWKSIKTATKSE